MVVISMSDKNPKVKNAKKAESAQEKKKNTDKGSLAYKIDNAAESLVAPLRPENKAAKYSILFLCIILTALLFRKILDGDLGAMANLAVLDPYLGSALMKFALSCILLGISGEFMRHFMGWDGGWGLIFFRDRSILGWIDRQAKKYSKVWIMLADLGIIMGYGLSSYYVFGKEMRNDRKKLAVLYPLGLLCLVVFFTLIAPFAISVIMGMVQGNDVASATSQIKSAVPGQDVLYEAKFAMGTIKVTWISLVLLGILLLGGLSTVTTLSIIVYGAILLGAVGQTLMQTGPGIAHAAPGGMPLLPGVNLPFVEGILALAILLVVHELSHGFLARIANVRLDSAGIVFYGILPFGAFVDPDEKEMEKLPDTQHNRLLAAGSAANLITSMIFALLMGLMFAFALGPLIAGKEYVQANTAEIFGMTLKSVWNMFIGLYLFVATTVALTFALNVLVGTVNLLPLPFFDGHHIVKRALGNDKILRILGWICIAAFVLNFLPWLFR